MPEVQQPNTVGEFLRRRFSLLGSALGPFLALAGVVLFFAVADHYQTGGGSFLTVRNLRTISVQTSTVAVAALGMTIVIIAGGIDLSAGTAMALSATVLAWSLKNGYTPPLAVAAALATGCIAGCLNGLLISALRVVPFIVTLGTMTFYLGLAKIVADETTVRPGLEQIPPWIPGLTSMIPDAWISIGLGPARVALPSGVWLALLLAAVLSAVLRWTVFGRHVFALGSNEATARLCGINVPGTKIAVYALAGLFVGLAGVFQFARLSSGNPVSGLGYELRFIAAVVIGGGSLSGGRGSVLGTLTGAAIMAVIASGCTILELRNPTQDIILGLIIVLAVTVDQFRQRRAAA